ncbi:F-box protein At5g03100-like [Humulus lupulus]|uniref:F-box protein At5g03100-like n=1 Tax=Humulus lupulus TaxID=3486 RepID=UPI002B4038CA|nr:F-box protein At5g03100-like [Humulus lupulus]
MAKKRVKMTSSMAEEEDGFSKLPDAIILYILSLLPTVDVVRICLLSKRLKPMWYLVPTLSFSDATTDFQSLQDVENFYKYVDAYLGHRRRGMDFMVDSDITSFKLQMKNSYHTSKSTRLDKWLDFLVENRVKEINIQLGFAFDRALSCYRLPISVLNARDLTVLELDRLDLNTAYSIRLPALKTLSLKNDYFEDNLKDDAVFKLLLGCPSLEKLLLSMCDNLTPLGNPLRLQSLSLKWLKIKYLGFVPPLQVEAINLEYLVVNGFILEDTNLSACKAIRSLSLTFDHCNEEYPSISLEYLISTLPHLENLTLKDCFKVKLEQIKISNQQLTSFTLKNRCIKYDFGMNVIIESAPKLASFCYEGNTNFSISMKSSNLLNGKFVIHNVHENYDANGFFCMMNFLLNLNCSWNIVTLHVPTDKVFIMPEYLKRICHPSLLKWKHLRVMIDCKSEIVSNLKDALLRISPSLETLCINEKDMF